MRIASCSRYLAMLLTLMVGGCENNGARPVDARADRAVADGARVDGARADARLDGRHDARQAPDGRRPPVDGAGGPDGGSGVPTLYVWMHTHHWTGDGGNYPDADDVLSIIEGVEEANQGSPDIPIRGTFYLDGLLLEKFASPDWDGHDGSGARALSKLLAFNDNSYFDLGYHSDEAHGPIPVGDSLFQGATSKHLYSLRDMDPFALYDYVTARFSHAFGPSNAIAATGQPAPAEYTAELIKDVLPNGKPDPFWRKVIENEAQLASSGGVALVNQKGYSIKASTTHRETVAWPGFFFAANLRDLVLDQGSTVFATKLLWPGPAYGAKNAPCNPQVHTQSCPLEEKVRALGGHRALIWYMGKPILKAIEGGESAAHESLAEDAAAVAGGGGVRVSFISLQMFKPNVKKSDVVDYLESRRALIRGELRKYPGKLAIRFMKASELAGLLEPEVGRTLAKAEVEAAAANLLAGWKGRPPEYVTYQGTGQEQRALSLADAFYLMARYLESHAAGGASASFTLDATVFGPVGLKTALNGGITSPLTVSLDSVARQAAGAVATHTFGSGAYAQTIRAVPLTATLGGAKLNGAELLYGMAQAVSLVAAGKPGDTKITIAPAAILSQGGELLVTPEGLSPSDPQYYDKVGIFLRQYEKAAWDSQLQMWTAKPPRFGSTPP